MNEARVHILKMLREGKITVEEAARLIETLGSAPRRRKQAGGPG